MSNDFKDKSSEVEQAANVQPSAPQPKRRLFIFKAVAILTAVVAVTLGKTTAPAQAQRRRRRRKSADGIYYGQDTVAGHSHDLGRRRGR